MRRAAACAAALTTVVLPAHTATAAVESNWAGYVVTGPHVSFTNVSGVWKEPRVRCRRGAQSTSAIWVGLGGYDGASELEQIGTDANCNESGRQVSYAWFDLVPYPGNRIKLPVQAGDVVAASVAVTYPNVVLRLENRTRHWVFARSIAMQAEVSSAEWIIEAPISCLKTVCREPALADFGAVTLDHVLATSNGQTGSLVSSLWTATPLALAPGMVSSNASNGDAPDDVALVLQGGAHSTAGAAPTRASADGSAFTVAWHP